MMNEENNNKNWLNQLNHDHFASIFHLFCKMRRTLDKSYSCDFKYLSFLTRIFVTLCISFDIMTEMASKFELYSTDREKWRHYSTQSSAWHLIFFVECQIHVLI